MTKKTGPKVLILDCETSPIMAYVWGLWENNVALNQIAKDWHLMSWAAKWLGDKKVHYMDQRGVKPIENDKVLCRGIWNLLDEADVIISQNGKSFDIRRLNARFVEHGFQPPSGFKHIDLKILAKKHFGFPSHRLEYMTEKLNKKYKKGKHKKFEGFALWRECMAGNKAAWNEMREYNILDVLATEELYHKLVPWDGGVNLSAFVDDPDACHLCGGEVKKKGYAYTQTGKFQRYICTDCGAQTRGAQNLLTKDERARTRRIEGR